MIEVKFDPSLELPDIRMPIYSETEENDPKGKEYGADYDVNVLQQTKVDGVMVPLVRLGNQTIFFSQIVEMHLTCDHIPMLDITIDDQLGLIKNLDTPSFDNNLQLQIIPPFDDAYKKINLMFYITSINISGSIIRIHANYHIPNLWNHVMKAYGEITTYEYMEQTAKDLGLGFCSNVSDTKDKRYIYNPMQTRLEHIRSTVEYSHDDTKESVYDWWIDYWNNLNFVNLYSEYREKRSEDDLQIWTVTKQPNISGEDNTQVLEKRLAALTNDPFSNNSQLFINSYTPVYDSPGVTDQILDTWMMDSLEQQTTLIENGDVRDNIQQKYIYGGEVFGDYNYIARRAALNLLKSKISAQTIRTSIILPTLGLIQGGKVNLWWYDQGNYITGPIQVDAEDQVESNQELPPSLPIGGDGSMGWVINKMVSGQYYIKEMSFHYKTQFVWRQEFVLSRDGQEFNKYNEPVLDDSEKN